MRSHIAHGLHALAHEVAIGYRDTGMPTYTPDPDSGLPTTRLIPSEIHHFLCTSQSVLLFDPQEDVIICDACRFAVAIGSEVQL